MKQVSEKTLDDPLKTICRLLTEKETTGLKACVRTRNSIKKRFQNKPPYRFVVQMKLQVCGGEEKKWGKLLRPDAADLFMEVMYLLDLFFAGAPSLADTIRLITTCHFHTFYQDFLEQAAGAGRQGEWPSSWFRDAVKEKEQGLLSARKEAPATWWLAEKIVFVVVYSVISQLKKTLPACSARADEFLEALSCQCDDISDREGATVPVPQRLPEEMKAWLKSYAEAPGRLSERIRGIIDTSREEAELGSFHRGKEAQELLDLLTVRPENDTEKVPTATPDRQQSHTSAVQPAAHDTQPTTQVIQSDLYFLQPTAYIPQSVIQTIQPTTSNVHPATTNAHQNPTSVLQPNAHILQTAVHTPQPIIQDVLTAPVNMQPAPSDIQFSAYDLQPAAQDSQPATSGISSAGPNVQPDTVNMQPASSDTPSSTYDLQPATHDLQPAKATAPYTAAIQKGSTALPPKEQRLRRMKDLFRNPVTDRYDTSDIRLLDSLLHALTDKGMLNWRDSLPIKKKFTRQMIGLLSKMLFSKDSPDAPAWHRFPNAYTTPFALLFGMGENQIRAACSTALHTPKTAQLKDHLRHPLPPAFLHTQPA